MILDQMEKSLGESLRMPLSPHLNKMVAAMVWLRDLTNSHCKLGHYLHHH